MMRKNLNDSDIEEYFPKEEKKEPIINISQYEETNIAEIYNPFVTLAVSGPIKTKDD